jgi:TonB-dependent starch-binding outer membrane protein SusC
MRIPLLLALCLTVLPLPSLAQDRTVSGRVTDAAGNALPGVNISILNTSAGTITDIEGNYSLQVPADATVLVFSYIGYVRIEEPLNGRSRIDIVLEEDTPAA